MEKNLGLGKGLSALMGNDTLYAPQTVRKSSATDIIFVNAADLEPSPFQPRRVFTEEALSDLVSSIREKGILQPLLVRRNPRQPMGYEIIAGERRFRASKIAGLSQIPVIVKDFDDKATLEVALIENLQREDLNPLEEAEAYRRLLQEFRYTQEQLSQVVGKSRSHVANMMRLMDLPNEIKSLIEEKELTIGHARALLNAQNPVELAQEVVKKGLSVRQTEKLATTAGGVKTHRRTMKQIQKKMTMEKDADILALEKEMSNLLKTTVTINWTGQGGEVVVSYDSLDKLDVILQQLMQLDPIGE